MSVRLLPQKGDRSFTAELPTLRCSACGGKPAPVYLFAGQCRMDSLGEPRCVPPLPLQMRDAFADAIASAQQELVVEIARTPEQILEAKKLRYRVYCEERGYEPGEGGIEQDEYDDNGRHILVRSRTTGEVFGTVRLVLTTEEAGAKGFPMDRVCEDYVLAPLPKIATLDGTLWSAAGGDISRLDRLA